MNAFARSTIKLAAVAAATLPLIAFAAGAHAEDGRRLKVGDLTQADQAAAFARQLDAVGDELCAASPGYAQSLQRKTVVASCKQVVRDEAMRQLSPTQQVQFAAYSRQQMASAR